MQPRNLHRWKKNRVSSSKTMLALALIVPVGVVRVAIMGLCIQNFEVIEKHQLTSDVLPQWSQMHCISKKTKRTGR